MASLFEAPPFSGSLFPASPYSSSQLSPNLILPNTFSFSPNPKFAPSSSHSNASAVCTASAATDPPPSNPNLSLERVKDRRKIVRVAWEKLVRWSRSWRSKAKTDVLEKANKVVILGGGSFGTAMASHIADRKAQLEVNMLMRDPQVCQSVNERH